MNSIPARRQDLDLAKGLGILLVVFGHIAAKQQPGGNAWYTYAQTAVYTFHMPFFLYLSGYVAFMTGVARTTPALWPRMAARRSERLLLPFMAFGIILVFGKLIASRFMYVDNGPRDIAEGFINLVWNTDASPAVSIWYMFIVFICTLLTPVLFWLGRDNSLVPLAVAVGLFFSGLPHYIFGDRLAEFFLFFILGGMAADLGDKWLRFIDQSRWLLTILLVLAIVYFFSLGTFSPHWSHLVCGIASLPALHGLVRSRIFEKSRFLAALGNYSFVIYLLNTPVMGVEKGLLLKWIPWDGPGFLLHATAMLAGGLYIPVLVKRALFRHWPYIDRLTN